MNINAFLNIKKIEDEEARDAFVDFISEQEDVLRFKVFALEKSIEEWQIIYNDSIVVEGGN